MVPTVLQRLIDSSHRSTVQVSAIVHYSCVWFNLARVDFFLARLFEFFYFIVNCLKLLVNGRLYDFLVSLCDVNLNRTLKNLIYNQVFILGWGVWICLRSTFSSFFFDLNTIRSKFTRFKSRFRGEGGGGLRPAELSIGLSIWFKFLAQGVCIETDRPP